MNKLKKEQIRRYTYPLKMQTSIKKKIWENCNIFAWYNLMDFYKRNLNLTGIVPATFITQLVHSTHHLKQKVQVPIFFRLQRAKNWITAGTSNSSFPKKLFVR
jgi:hypothetical protein